MASGSRLSLRRLTEWQAGAGSDLRRRASTPARIPVGALALGVACAAGGCGLLAVGGTASLGGDTAGERGSVRVVFLNNTPNRASFTFGTHDRANPFDQPDFRQFVLDPDGLRLEPNDASGIGTLRCGRVFSIGAPNLLELIERNASDEDIDETALVPGIAFYAPQAETGTTKSVGGALPAVAQVRPPTVGSAPPFEAALGVDFPCGALLVIRFEVDAETANSFRTDFELIPSETTR